MSGRILIVDDDQDMCEMLAATLATRGFEVESEVSPDAALARLDAGGYDVVVSDMQMPGIDGVELCARIAAAHPDVAVVLITAFGSMDTAIAAIRAGAYDFLPKPFEDEQLIMVLQRAVRFRSMSRELVRLREQVRSSKPYESLIGASPAMRKLFDILDRVSDLDVSILICGESGTGKELVARAIHERSDRAGAPFVALNCAAVPPHLLESELFGHRKGAFTDAHTDRKGLFAQADGGTLLLDEIGEMPLELQPKLLRALQERTVRPVGGEQEVELDARILAATNRDLAAEVEAGRFREDLYFRLDVVQVDVPPLRARGGDVLLLAHHFLEKFAEKIGKPVTSIDPAAAERLAAYDWPGNVRELQNCMERAVALTRFEQVVEGDLPERIRAYQVSHVVPSSDDPADLVPMEELERRYIRRVLTVVRGNKSHAARILGYERKTLYRRMERLGIEMDFGAAG